MLARIRILHVEHEEAATRAGSGVRRNDEPLGVGAISWLPRGAVGEEIVALLPQGRVVLDPETEAALMRAFGTGGEFEVEHS